MEQKSNQAGETSTTTSKVQKDSIWMNIILKAGVSALRQFFEKLEKYLEEQKQ